MDNFRNTSKDFYDDLGKGKVDAKDFEGTSTVRTRTIRGVSTRETFSNRKRRKTS